VVYTVAIFVNRRNNLEFHVPESATLNGSGGTGRRCTDREAASSLPCPTVYTLLGFLQVIISGVLIFLILLHSGKDTGLSGAFGIGGGGSSFGGGSMVERNLDRATIFFAILFAVNTLVLLKI